MEIYIAITIFLIIVVLQEFRIYKYNSELTEIWEGMNKLVELIEMIRTENNLKGIVNRIIKIENETGKPSSDKLKNKKRTV